MAQNLITLTHGTRQMPLRTVRISSLENLALNRIKELEPRIDSTVYGSITTNLIRSLAVAVHPLTYLAQDILDDAFPQTAKGEALDKFGTLDSVERKQASQSIGKISVFGTLGATVPLGEEVDVDNVTIYTKNPATIEAVTLLITSISAANGVVTCKVGADHWLARDAQVSITTSDARLNGTHKVIALVDGLGFSRTPCTTTPPFAGPSNPSAQCLLAMPKCPPRAP